MLKLTEFKGSIGFAGADREVLFSENTLTICNLTPSEATTLVSMMSGVAPVEAPPSVLPRTMVLDGAALPGQGELPARQERDLRDAKPKETAKAKPTKTVALAVVLPPAEEKPEPEAKPVPEKLGLDLAGDGSGDDNPRDPGNTDLPERLPDALKAATRVREVLQHLFDTGVTTKAGAIKECERLRDQLPVLQRVTDIPDRIGHTWDVLGLGQ